MKQLLLTVHLLLQAMFSKLLYTKRIEVLLLDKLFNGTSYNINSLPRLPGGVVNLTFDVAIQQLINLNEKKEVIELSMWIRQYWNDPFFVWNTSEWQDLNRLIVSPDRVWKPDIKLYNKSTCKLDMRYFPFDEQICPLTFGSWVYDQTEVNFFSKKAHGDLSYLSKSGEFIIEKLDVVRHSKRCACCQNPCVTLTFNLHLQRRGKYYLFKIILPGILIALLSCFSFILPPLTSERTGLVITNLLSLSVYVLNVANSVPPSSETYPVLVKFYTILISEIGFALIVNCIIITLDTKTTHVPKWIGAIFLQNNFKFFIIALKNKVFSKLSQNSQTTFQNSLFQDAVQRCSKDTKNILSGYPYYEKTKATTFFDTRSNLEKTLITESDPINFESFVINKDFEYLELNEYLCAEFDCNKTQKEWKEVLKSIDVLFFIFFFDCNNRKHRFYFFNCTQC
ncbi:neuronal acetylcholine receptor subunit alpha-9 isoform X2 [Hydra vulgaris]|uniref:neuronal acetylcholine receptor subunit alpha-9 isoform X2 n=1 Tax=Hydra vulgaris TaxID=6087 RepID=UPI001F5E6EBE|nr:neuronal acetylcholine receptor subunit alpha-9 isoform X2 [Hydra vulgaris]